MSKNVKKQRALLGLCGEATCTQPYIYYYQPPGWKRGPLTLCRPHYRQYIAHKNAAIQAKAVEPLEALFDLQFTRTVEADALWREAHPGNDLVVPDLGTLIGWLLSERRDRAGPHGRPHGLSLIKGNTPTCVCGQQFETMALFDGHITQVAVRANRTRRGGS